MKIRGKVFCLYNFIEFFLDYLAAGYCAFKRNFEFYEFDPCRDIPRNPASHKTTDKQESDRDVAMPLFLSTSSHKPSLSKGENNSALGNMIHIVL